MNNFEFKHNGMTLWYSRSLCTVLYVFGYSKYDPDNVYLLVNKRGEGAPTAKHKWVAPCGYLDFNETLEECACRECFEETGVKINPKSLKMWILNSTPYGDPDKTGKQNVTVHYTTTLPYCIEDSTLSPENSEPEEVEDIQWIPLSKISEYEFGFDQEKRVIPAYNFNILNR